MTLRSTRTYFGLLLVWLTALLLAIGSKSYDPEIQDPVPNVVVDFSVSNNGTVTIQNGDTNDSVSSVVLRGSFEKAGNASITLREVPVTLDTSTSFTVAVSPTEGDNFLEGTVDVVVTQDLEFGLERLPTNGQLSLLRDGTTTLITFDGNANNVVIAVGDTTLPALTFSDLRSVFNNRDRTLNERFASKAYRTLETLWLMSRFSETAQQNVTSNIDTIQSMGFNSPLTLECANSSGSPTPAYSVSWTVDPAGTGLGEPGDGDTFEFSWTNCQFTSENRYFERELQLANYQLNNDTIPRNMSYSSVFTSTLIGESIIEATTPTLTRSRINGTLIVSASEGATVAVQN